MWSETQRRIERFNRSHQRGDMLLVWPDGQKNTPGVMSSITGEAFVSPDGDPCVPVRPRSGVYKGKKILIPLTQVA